MNTDLVIPESPAVLDHASDPGAVMVALVEQAKTLLQQANGMEGIATVLEAKSRAEAIRVYVQQKDMGHDAELAAAEIVRRAERRIGELIRQGQAEGQILAKGQNARWFREDRLRDVDPLSAKEIIGAPHFSGVTAMTVLADNVTEEQFEKAIDAAKSEGNLSRRNVVRKIVGTPKPQADRHELLYKTRRFDSVRFVRETVRMAPATSPLFDQVDYSALDLNDVEEWIGSLSSSIRFLTTLRNNLKELIRDRS